MTIKDRVTQQVSGFDSFHQLVEGTFPTYRPSLDMRDKNCRKLAKWYDLYMLQKGDPRRAFRYGVR
jgi:hypothetical protein